MAKRNARSRKGIPKGNKRQRTRAKLLEAAAVVIGEKGLDRTSLEEVAARAGMSRGAIYGNFKNKEELFLAIAETRWKPIIPPQSPPGTTLKERMRSLGQAVVAAAPERRANAAGALSFYIYNLNHEEMRSRMVTTNAQIYRWGEERLLQAIPSSELPIPASQFVRVVHALTEGVLALRFLTPELISDETIVAAFEALAGKGE